MTCLFGWNDVWDVIDALLEQKYGWDQPLLGPRRAPKDVNEILRNCVEVENTSTPLFK